MWHGTCGQEEDRDLMEMLGLEESVDQLAKANGVRWLGHVLRRDGDHVLRKRWN